MLLDKKSEKGRKERTSKHLIAMRKMASMRKIKCHDSFMRL
jgi:hypothetical protein